MSVRRALPAVPLLLLAAGPWILPRDLVTALLFTFLLITLASNYDLLGGFLGLYNLGQASFFGLGAYVTFLLLLRVPLLAALGPAGSTVAALAGGAAAAISAVLLAYPLLRLRGAYFAVGTFALLLLLRLTVDNLPQLTGGSHGLYVSAQHYLSLRAAYLLTLSLAAASLLLNALLASSRLGMAMTAVRENELAAAAAGVDRFRVQQVAFVLGATPTGLAGAVFGLHSGYIDVSVVLGIERSLFPVIAAMIGGSGLVWGPVVGAVTLRAIDVALKNYMQLPVPAPAIYGGILVVMSLTMPKGILAGLTRAPQAAARSGSPAPPRPARPRTR
ncbi:MAG: branched-chain amino acid ABC transporter permease [Armatimonadota bacterium]|nr:branched-chain amino acid ABC transporter permease [Armatimonadota bacterium]MDR7422606.1 branched-chain amino acid ABC transporter permease [Armatimonadota bacterium]MDR7453571.1 branched-chain amino acid ABC transporter permease [Armatimonadota bacterium]MDR7456383.1 branched-chain amino acid ABC transporter permease [Armatimonadota bacterium]MDR7496679.1 branched-chain amino acid ABC transporter permease [Armatimonadota bacterium]